MAIKNRMLKKKYLSYFGICLLGIVFSFNIYALENRVSIDTIKSAGLNNLSKFKDGKGNVKFFIKLFRSFQGKEFVDEQEIEYKVYFIGPPGGKIKYESFGKFLTNGREIRPVGGHSHKAYFDGEKAIVYWVEQNTAHIVSKKEMGAFFTPINVIHPLCYGITFWDYPPFPLLFKKDSQKFSNVNIVEHSDYLILESVKEIKEGYFIKSIIRIDPYKDFFTNQKKILVRKNGQEWLPDTEINIVPTKNKFGWIPKEVSITKYRISEENGKMLSTRFFEEKIIYENFEFNIDLKESDLEIKLPKGTIVRDEIVKTSYKVE